MASSSGTQRPRLDSLSSSHSRNSSNSSMNGSLDGGGVSRPFLHSKSDAWEGGGNDLFSGRTQISTEQQERRLSFLEGLKLYPTALGWSVFFSLGIVMTAFDQQLVGSLYATPAFQRDFGYEYMPGKFVVRASWQTALSMCGPLGQTIGAFLGTYPMEWYGRKKVFAVAVVLTSGLVFFQFFARSLPVLYVGELLGGIVLGVYTVLAPSYASEVCPLPLRGLLTSYVNLCWVMGQLVATGIIAGTSRLDNHWAYSAPFAAQWFWPAVILAGLTFAPESPWWLVRQGRHNDAERSLQRLASSQVDVKHTLSVIIETDRLEQELESGSTYKDCLRGTNRRRTEIAVGVYCMQVASGVYLASYVTYFFTLAGLSTEKAFNLGVGFLATGFVGTLLSWVLLPYVGRRRIYTTGLAILAVLLLTVGIIDCVPDYDSNSVYVWAQGALLLAWNFCYGISVGPVCFVIACEVSATKLRSKTIALATASQTIVGIAMAVAIPYLINPDEVNARGKTGFFFGGLALIGLVWCVFRIPETGGRTYEELDIMFARGVKTRRFSSHVVDPTESYSMVAWPKGEGTRHGTIDACSN